MTSLVYPMISNEPKSLHFLNQTKSRLNQFLTSKELNDAFYLNRINNVNNNNVKLEVYSCFGRSQLTFIEAVKQHFKPTEKGISLAPSWSQLRIILSHSLMLRHTGTDTTFTTQSLV